MIDQDKLLSTTSKKIIYDEKPSLLIKKREVKGVEGAFILDNVLSGKECQRWIEISEEMGYGIAPISIGDNLAQIRPDFRDNKRVMWDCPADNLLPLWNRIKDFIPKELTFKGSSLIWKVKEDFGLNERLRFYRYDQGQKFKPHFDGAFRRSNTEKSHLTFILYLNEGFKGGQTTFFPKHLEDRSNSVRVNPVKGSALLFFHTGYLSPLHEGSPHSSAGKQKYVLRSDIMYYHDIENELDTKKIDWDKQGKDRETQEKDYE
jgi:prolyl 4-hydroxylase